MINRKRILLALCAAVITSVLFVILQMKTRLESFEPPPFECTVAETAASYQPPSLFLEDLTWMEIREALCNGCRGVIIPTGGTEQNGPHMILGKHNDIIRYSAAEIAGQIGNLLIAPVVAHVPEGQIHPPEGHMRFTGTLSLSEDTYRAVLKDTARSLIQHGFRNIFFLGDSFNNQRPQEEAAVQLNRKFSRYGVRVSNAGDYYFSKDEAVRWLEAQGESADAIGTHAGIRDTSELLFVRPEGVRLPPTLTLPLQDEGGGKGRGAGSFERLGFNGRPERATREYGQKILEIRVAAAVRQIREALSS